MYLVCGFYQESEVGFQCCGYEWNSFYTSVIEAMGGKRH
jgi:hypothetical protein